MPYRPLPSAKANTFPEREGDDLFRRQSRHLTRMGKATSLGAARHSPQRGKRITSVGNALRDKTRIVKLSGNVLFSRFFPLIIPAVLCYDMFVLL